MVDNFAIAVSHLLVALAAWRLVWRADLDKEPPPAPDEFGSGFFRQGQQQRGTKGESAEGTRDA